MQYTVADSHIKFQSIALIVLIQLLAMYVSDMSMWFPYDSPELAIFIGVNSMNALNTVDNDQFLYRSQSTLLSKSSENVRLHGLSRVVDLVRKFLTDLWNCVCPCLGFDKRKVENCELERTAELKSRSNSKNSSISSECEADERINTQVVEHYIFPTPTIQYLNSELRADYEPTEEYESVCSDDCLFSTDDEAYETDPTHKGKKFISTMLGDDGLVNAYNELEALLRRRPKREEKKNLRSVCRGIDDIMYHIGLPSKLRFITLIVVLLLDGRANKYDKLEDYIKLIR